MAKASEVRQNYRAAAVALCEAGFAIYPLSPASKIPAIASAHPKGSPERGRCRGECGELGHGFYDASTDLGWVDRYWAEHPDHGIAARPGPHQMVLDVDPRHGGDVALAGLETRYGSLPETFAVFSGRGDGGRHLWFSGVSGPTRARLCPGVDVISHDRGAVVMPPSLHPVSRQPYRYQEPLADIAPASAWLQEMVGRPELKATPTFRRRGRRLSPMQVRRKARGLIATVSAAPPGERHTALYWAVSRAVEDGLLGEVDDWLGEALADAASAAGLDHSEINATMTDAVVAALADRGW